MTGKAPFVITLCALASACAPGDPGPTHFSRQALLERIEAGAAPPIIDVRSTWEFNRGHVPGAVHVPFLAAFFGHGDIRAPKDQPIVVYCEHGPRAGVAKFALRRAGFGRVLYLEDHMRGWRKAGLPVDKGPDE